jgi:type VI secretion system ImpA family protein
MASQDLVDVAVLLAPLSESDPCGVDLRWDTVYDEIRAARQQNDRSAFEGESTVAPKWPLVIDRAADVLSTRSKDLMIAAWMAEALMHQHGFAGLRQGLTVINGLIENYWEPLYPRPDEGDWEPRAAPLVWLTEPDRGARLPNFLRELPLAPNLNGDGEEYSYNYWEARTPKGAAGDDEEAYARRQAEAARKTQQFDDAVAAASRDYYAALLGEIQGCTAEIARFDKAVDELLGRDAPGTSAVRDSIAKCDDLVRRILRNKGGMESPDAEEGSPEAGAAEGASAGQGGPAGPIRSREDAFRRLEEVAAFLRRTEPQSPVSYLVERAVAWGRMPFGRLLGELIKDEGARGHVVELLGIKEDPQ